ncbi:hypothetical protein [Anaeromyxobacter dehalogenans]|uniref:Transmembrane protein n=1 Tax=Anaeromyxobacter dehalogenans (strain 2CP-C) TaxID=290397 RepID=Q2IPJ8_ANADE|nr:hypothetical protein [Anaeromyxobacter dehalogenans]ABC80733.1 hypothetical protein Adeh_0958 [Anaeromyxobacter dehalogenans 2CP-C]
MAILVDVRAAREIQDGEAGCRWERPLALGQGAFYAATGAWPLVHMPSFVAVTGPKLEPWLVRTVGVLIGAIGGTLLSAGARRRITPEVRWLALASAAGIAAVELWYAGRRRRIAPVYLLDGAGELALAAAWAALGAGRRLRGGVGTVAGGRGRHGREEDAR